MMTWKNLRSRLRRQDRPASGGMGAGTDDREDRAVTASQARRQAAAADGLEKEDMGYFETIYASGLPHRAVAVYMYLHDRADRDKSCWPAIPTMARELGMSRSTIKRALNDLVSAGYLRKEFRYRENGSHTSNLYTIL